MKNLFFKKKKKAVSNTSLRQPQPEASYDTFIKTCFKRN